MIELFTPKQIRCEHCEFEFVMTGFGSAAKIVCLACGKETVLSPPKATVASGAAGRKAEFPEIMSNSAAKALSAAETLLCSVEQCPLLTDTGSEAGSAIADQVKLRLRRKAQRRRNILAWTVTLQICVLISVALFVAKPLLIPNESLTANLVTDTDTGVDTGTGIDTDIESVPDTEQTVVALPPPVRVPPPPLPAVPEVRVAEISTPDGDPFAVMPESEQGNVPTEMSSPFETVYHIFPPPMFEPTISAPDTGGAIPGSLLPIGLSIEPMTLEMADFLLESAKTTLGIDPENSVRQAVDAAKIYETLGYTFPDSLYWILGNAFASLSWGEPLLESSPPIEMMTLSADNRYLLAQLRDSTVWLWDLQSPEEERAGFLLDEGTGEYVRFVFSPDLRWIIGGQRNGMVRIWDMSLTNPAGTFITFTERVPDLQDLQISPNGHWLAAFGNSPQPDYLSITGSPPSPVLLWNLRQMEAGIVPIATPIPSKPEPVRIIRFSPKSDRLAIGGRNAVGWVYDLTARGVEAEPFVLQGHRLGITQIAFAPCGQWMATGSQDNTVRLWNLTSDRWSPESATLFGHMGWISTLTIDQTGEYIFSGSYDRTIRIWNISRNRIITALNTQPIVLKTNLGVPESVALTQDGDKMIVQGSEGSLGIYHLPSLLEDDPEDFFRAITFRNSRLSISKKLLTTDDQLLIFSYEHLTNPSNNGIRLWALRAQPFVR